VDTDEHGEGRPTDGTTAADSAGGDDTTDSAEGPPAPSRRPGTVVLLVGLALAAAVGVVALIWSGEEQATPAPDPFPTTTLATTAPTTTIAPATVATATAPQIVVSSTPPPDWDTAALTVAPLERPAPEASQVSMPARPPLPRVGYPVEGRVAESGGWRFANPTSFGEPFTMLVIEGRGDWLRVELPVRPNGTPGWVRRSEVILSTVTTRIEVHLADRTLRAWDGSRLIAETQIVVGTDDTRTPTGRFYLTDRVQQSNAAGFFGPWVLAINAYSEQMDTFDDGVPVVALHGTSNPAQLGQAVSNGCIRMPNEVVTLLAERLPLGTPVDIFPGASGA
jgi:lipoprotein-anchoring transpeptidase ErfK/SrfK